MSDSPPIYVPDKAEIRERLSLDFTCAKEGVLLNRDGKAKCPFHDDNDPSFHLYEGDDGITRWHCYPCSDGGDVLDFIRRARGLSFPEALTYAAKLLAELPADYTPPQRSSTPRRNPDDWVQEVNEARGRATTPEAAVRLSAYTGFVTANDTLQEAQDWDFFLRNTYGWGLGVHGAVYMPHWDAASSLTGCKVRHTDGGRTSLEGSKYENLYGAWLGRRHRDVLLAEGETDTVWAAYTATQERINIDVFGIPSGANQPVLPSYLDFLKGARRIYLAFDPDEAGVQATRAWIDALNNAGFQDVRVCCLPYKRDLRDCQPTLRTLLSEAKKPLGTEGINLLPSPAGYLRQDNEGNSFDVTTWTVDPIAQLAGDGDAGFDAYLNTRGVQRRVVIRLHDLASTFTLNKWANQHEEIFTGNDAVRKDIAEYVKALGSITPEIFQTAQVGLHRPPERYHFAGPSVVLTGEDGGLSNALKGDDDGYIGQLPWRYAPGSKAADVTGRLWLPYRHQPENTDGWRWSLLEDFISLSSTDVMHPLLAWLVAASRRSEIREFPILFMGGSSGVGKSTLARLGIRLVGSNIEIDLGAITPFILSRTLASTTTLPVFVDEWTRLSRQDTREAFQGIVPLLYTGGMAERGQADLSVQTYRMTAPTLVAGEDAFSYDRELERIVIISPSRANQNTQARARLQDRRLEGFGQYLHTWLCDTPTASLPPFPAGADDRVEYNRQVLLTGWATLREYLHFMGHTYHDIPDIPAVPDLSCFEHEYEHDDENVYVQALRLGLEMKDRNGVALVWDDPNGRGVWLRARTLVKALDMHTDLKLPGGGRAMLNYFRERYDDVVLDKHVPVPLAFTSVSAALVVGLTLNGHKEEVESEIPVFPQA